MEGRQREIAFGHPFDEAGDGLLVVGGGEGGGQPQPERPGGRERRPAGQGRVLAQDLLRRGAVDDVVLQLLALGAELDARDLLGGDLEGHLARVVDEDAVAGVGQVERDVLVRLFAAGAAVGVPDVDALAVLDERAEALTETVDGGADVEAELLADVVLALGGLHQRHGLDVAAGQGASVGLELHPPVAVEAEADAQVAGREGGFFVVDGHDGVVGLVVQFEVRAVLDAALEVGDAYADDTGHRRGAVDGDERALEQVTAVPDVLGGRVDSQCSGSRDGIEDLGRIRSRDAFAQQPVPVGELHRRCLSRWAATGVLGTYGGNRVTSRRRRRCLASGSAGRAGRRRSRAVHRAGRRRWSSSRPSAAGPGARRAPPRRSDCRSTAA